MTVVSDAIQAINDTIKGAIPFVVAAFGNTRLMYRDNQRFPVQLWSKDGEPLTPDNKRPFLIYHRIDQVGEFDSDADGFGCENKDLRLEMRAQLFVLGIQSTISKDLKDTNDTVGLVIMDAMPKGVFDASDALRNASFSSKTITFDSRAILDAEFAGAVRSNLLPDLVACRIDYNLTGRICSDICT